MKEGDKERESERMRTQERREEKRKGNRFIHVYISTCIERVEQTSSSS